MIALLEDKRRLIEADLDRRIDAEDRMARRRAILSSIPGVGAHISALVVVEMPELGAIDRKAAASLAGLAPHPSQSGLSRGRNAISGGRPCVRAAFYMAALVATRSHPKFKQAYLDLRAAENRPRSPSSPSRAASHPRQRPHPRQHSLQQRTLRLTSSIQSPAVRCQDLDSRLRRNDKKQGAVARRGTGWSPEPLDHPAP